MNRRRTGFAVFEGKPKTAEQQRQAIESELRALPELEAPGTIWQAIEQRLDAGDRRQRRFLKRAFAAGAVAAALSAVILLSLRNPAPAPHQVAGAAVPEELMAELIERSRLAESRRRSLQLFEGARLAAVQRAVSPGAVGHGAAARGVAARGANAQEAGAQETGAWGMEARGMEAQGMEARRLLAARIASVDASLNRLATVGAAEPAAQERLWRERVELMDTLMRAEQVQREEFIRRAVY